MKSIAVFCGSNLGNDPGFKTSAYQMGKELAKNNMTLIYGGAKVGLMGRLADGVLENGGYVIGVLPRFLAQREIEHPGISRVYHVNTMEERKQMVHKLSDASITLPGGIGSMEEIFEKLSSKQLGLHKQPIAILNVFGFYDNLILQLKQMTARGFFDNSNFNSLIIEESEKLVIQKLKLTYYCNNNGI